MFPKTAFQQKLHLPLAGASAPGDYNLIYVAEEGASRLLARHRGTAARCGAEDPRRVSFPFTTLRFRRCAGHDIDRVQRGICAGIASSFNATSYMAGCSAESAHLAREARGLRMQHDDA